MNTVEHPIAQPIKMICVKLGTEGMVENGARFPEVYQVGYDGVTRIEATVKPGMYSNIPYLVVWKGDIAFAEFGQHNIAGVYFEAEKIAE